MEFFIWIVHVLVAVALIGLVLLQHGKGADMGAAFGSGSSGSLFGATGSANFMSRTTAILAAMFFATSLALTFFSGRTAPHPVAKPVPASVPAPVSGPVPSAPPSPVGAIPN